MKDIPGKEGLYAVTEDGQVWSYPKGQNNRKGKWLKLYLRPDGYLEVGLRKEGVTKGQRVHRLVGVAYLPASDKPEINHKNGIKTDNRVSNLEWCTRSENETHAFRTGLAKVSDYQRAAVSKRLSKPVKNARTGEVFSSAAQASWSLGYHRQSVSVAICQNITCAGDYWEYV